MMNGQQYAHVTGMLGLYSIHSAFSITILDIILYMGLQPCSEKHWRNIVEWLEGFVSRLAEVSCEAVREAIRKSGDEVATYDGFYLTRGHYSNNCLGTLKTGKIARFVHRMKRGNNHNWEGTSAGAEGDMLDEVLKSAKEAGFNVTEIVTDKDSSMKSIYWQYFPEGVVTYCSNHCTKTLHSDLQKIKQEKCQVGPNIVESNGAPIPRNQDIVGPKSDMS